MALSTATSTPPAPRRPYGGMADEHGRHAALDEPIRVVIVDDDADDRLMVRHYLNGARSRFSIVECEDGSDLAGFLEQDTVDCILIDQRLGEQLGTDVIRTIGGSRASVPAILLTGSDDEALEEEAIEAGAAEHLNKADLSSRVLERTIKYVVKWHGDQQELRRQSEQLQVAWSEAARANRAKSVFLACMSHELRTPLNAIIGFSSMLLHGSTASRLGRVDEYAGFIREGGEQLLHLVDNLLDIARIEAGQFLLADNDVDLTDVLRGVIETNEPLARKRGVRVVLDLPSETPMVRADSSGLQQIFLNLLSNATKYTHADGVATIGVAAETGTVRVTVRDNGIGMTEDEISTALHPFMRIRQNAYVRSTEGAGLGLAIVNALVDQLGLEIDFQSQPGQGTTATVTFPPGRIVPRRTT